MSSITYCPACRRRSSGRKKLCNRCHWIKYTLHCSDPAALHHLNTVQSGRCKICGMFPPRDAQLCIDRNSTEVRGLLCQHCYQGMQSFSTLDLLQLAIEYLADTSLRIPFRLPRRRSPITAAQMAIAKATLANPLLVTMPDKAKSLANFCQISQAAAMSRLRRLCHLCVALT